MATAQEIRESEAARHPERHSYWWNDLLDTMEYFQNLDPGNIPPDVREDIEDALLKLQVRALIGHEFSRYLGEMTSYTKSSLGTLYEAIEDARQMG